MRWPIRFQILFPFVSTMLVAVSAVSLLNAYLAARRTSEQIERQLTDVATTLADARFPLTNAVLEQMHHLTGAEFLLADAEGDVQAASRPLVAHVTGSPESAADARHLHFESHVVIGDERFFQTTMRLNRTVTSGRWELLQILFPEQIWHDAQRAAALPSLVVGGVALVVVTLLSLIIAHRLSRPIVEVRTQVGRLAQADFREIPLPSRNDEVRDLVESVNRLARELDDIRQAIQRGERLTLLGQLSGGLAHHLRNDVTGAFMAVQLHQRECPAEDHESLTVALRQLSLMQEHLNRFLSAGRPQALQLISCRLDTVITDTVALIEPSMRHRKIELRTSIDLGPPLVVDPEQLRHLLLNLVLNAAEAAGPGGWVSIEATTAESDTAENGTAEKYGAADGATICVRDNGRGADPNIADRLFEPFATDKPEGVGLGLAVARQIAAAHGGSLEYLRADGVTSFLLKLPRNGAVTEIPQYQDPLLAAVAHAP